MKKIWFIITILVGLGLFFATTKALASPPALAAPKKTPDHTPGAQATIHANEKATQGTGNSQGIGKPLGTLLNYKGTIAVVGTSSLTLSLDDGSSLVFTLTADTRIKIPTLGHAATVANLLPGMLVNIKATQDAAGVLTARLVLLVPGKPPFILRVGIVTDYKPGISITILAHDGKNYTFLLTAKTKILPKEYASLLAVGARVTVIAPRVVTGGLPTATGIVVHPPETDGKHTPTPTYTPTPTNTPTPTATFTSTPTDTPTP